MGTVYSSLADLAQVFNKSKGIITIKSRVLFELLELRQSLHSTVSHIPLPPTQIGSITVFEAAIFSSLFKIKNPAKIVEIGTYIGYSTAVFALNSGSDSRIISIDLPGNRVESIDKSQVNREALQSDWKLNDKFLRHEQLIAGEVYIKSLPDDLEAKITLIKADSTELTASQRLACDNADMFFIDGGHDYSTIKSDSELASKSIKHDGIIVWHDYNSTIHREVTDYIKDELSLVRPIFHIENTLLAFTLNDSIDRFFRA